MTETEQTARVGVHVAPMRKVRGRGYVIQICLVYYKLIHPNNPFFFLIERERVRTSGRGEGEGGRESEAGSMQVPLHVHNLPLRSRETRLINFSIHLLFQGGRSSKFTGKMPTFPELCDLQLSCTTPAPISSLWVGLLPDPLPSHYGSFSCCRFWLPWVGIETDKERMTKKLKFMKEVFLYPCVYWMEKESFEDNKIHTILTIVRLIFDYILTPPKSWYAYH